MQTNQRLLTIIVILVLLGAVLLGVVAFLQRRGTGRPSPTANANVAGDTDAQTVRQLIDVRAKAQPDDRIVLFGSTLINPPGGGLRVKLKQNFPMTIEVDTSEGMTTRQALAILADLYATPPKYLVLDLGRYDAANGIVLQDTLSNLRLIVSKGVSLGSTIVVIGGVGSDGDTTLGSSVGGAVAGKATFVDATLLLLKTATRTSPTELNETGVDELARTLTDALRAAPKS